MTAAEPEPSISSDLDRVLRALRPEVTMNGPIGVASFEPQPEHRGNSGWLHGGFAATVLDHVCARVAAAALEQRVVTGRLDLRYPHPVVLSDGPFVVRAEHQPRRGRLVRVHGAIIDADDQTLVEANALFVRLG